MAHKANNPLITVTRIVGKGFEQIPLKIYRTNMKYILNWEITLKTALAIFSLYSVKQYKQIGYYCPNMLCLYAGYTQV